MTAADHVGHLYTAARAHGLDHAQAEELARNLAAAIPGAIFDACADGVRHRVKHKCIKLNDNAATVLAEALAGAWDS